MNSPRQLSEAVYSLDAIAAAPPKAKEEIKLSSKGRCLPSLFTKHPLITLSAFAGHITGSGSFQMILSDTGKVEHFYSCEAEHWQENSDTAAHRPHSGAFKPHPVRRANLRITFTPA